MIREEKRKGGGRPQRRKKSISGVTEVLGKQLSKNILTIPLQSCSLLYYNTHVRTHTHKRIKKTNKQTKEKKSSGRSYENYYFHIVGDRLDKSSRNTLNSLKPQQAS